MTQTRFGAGQYPVEMERGGADWETWDYGFVASVGEQWLVLQELIEGIFLEGYEVSRVADIQRIEADQEAGYVERAVSVLGGRPDVDFHLSADADTKDVLRAAADYSNLISVSMEARWDRPDVTSVSVGSRYVAALERFGEPRPPWPRNLMR